MLEELLRRDTDHGLLVAYALPARGDAAALERLLASCSDAERARAAGFAERRRLTFAGGRWVAREALREFGIEAPHIDVDDRGAPVVAGCRLSIAHKDDVACALVAPASDWSIGVDVEHADAVGQHLESQLCTAAESAWLASLDPLNNLVPAGPMRPGSPPPLPQPLAPAWGEGSRHGRLTDSDRAS